MIGDDYLSALVDTQDVQNFLEHGLIEDFFVKEEKDIFLFIKSHIESYGKLPQKGTLVDELGESSGYLPEVEEPIAYYFDKLKERHCYNKTLAICRDVEEHLKSDVSNGEEALSMLMQSATPLMLNMNPHLITDFKTQGHALIKQEYAEKLKPADEQKGIRLGWRSLDMSMDGAVPGDLISIIGRPGLGKTLLLQYIGDNARQQNKSCIIFSMEMKPTPIIQRQTAILTQCPLTGLRKGELSTPVYKKVLQTLHAFGKDKDSPSYWVVDASGMTLEDIRTLCLFFSPDLCLVDGAYLIKSSNYRLNKMDRVTETVEGLKDDIASALNIPVVATWQFNREVTKVQQKHVGIEHIGLSDAIGQLSSVVLGLFEEESIETKLRRSVSLLKGRNGEDGKFQIYWNFMQTSFREYFPEDDLHKTYYL